MKFSAQQIADFLHGDIVGDPSVEVDNISKIEEGEPGTLTFLANPKYTPFIYTTRASIVLTNRSFELKENVQATVIKVDDAYSSVAMLLNLVEQARGTKNGIEEPSYIAASATYVAPIYVGAFAYISENVTIGENAQIYPQVYIGDNVRIGKNVVLKPGVKIYHDCVIGDNCVLHAGVVVGADGFGFAPQSDQFMKIAQIGNVIIEDNVEIGANTTIDRATMGSTRVCKGVKLDNLIQIAHNVEVGQNTVIAAQTGIAGSTKVGSNCMIGGQVGLSGHLNIGDRVGFGAKTGVMTNVESGSQMIGYPAVTGREWAKSSVMMRKLPELQQSVRALQREIAELREALKTPPKIEK